MLSYPTIPLSNSNTFKFQIVHELHIDKEQKFFHKFFSSRSCSFEYFSNFELCTSYTNRGEIFLQDYTFKNSRLPTTHVFLLMVNV